MTDKRKKQIEALEKAIFFFPQAIYIEETSCLRSLLEDLKKGERWPKWEIEVQNETVEVPDELLPALNTIIFQMRIYTISKRQNEALTAIKILHSMQKFFTSDAIVLEASKEGKE